LRGGDGGGGGGGLVFERLFRFAVVDGTVECGMRFGESKRLGSHSRRVGALPVLTNRSLVLQ